MNESPGVDEQVAALKKAIAAQESLRPTLGDAVVDASIDALRKQLSSLESSSQKQRKLVTLLFTDIVGSTRFTQGLDPEDIMAIQDTALKELAAVIEEHDARVTRFAGDGFTAVFGLPLAREDDAERAIRAGLAMQEVAADYAARVEKEWGRSGFKIRVGINTGQVAAGGYSESSDTMMGLAVNLAARMESAAPPGGVLISHGTYRQVKGIFNVVPQAPLSAKGIPEPVQTYLVKNAKPHAFRIGRRGVEGVNTKMVGRDAELLQLQDAYESVAVERECQVVTIIGEAGVGKSRLLDEFQDWIDLRPNPTRFFKGRAYQNAQNLPRSLLKDLLEHRFQIEDSDDLSLVRRKLERGLGEGGSSQEPLPVQAQIIGRWLGFDLRDELKVQVGSAEELHNRAMLYLDDYLKRLAAAEPLVILLEDIHWADDSSLDAIDELARRLRRQPLLITGAARPRLFERRPQWGEGRGAHRRISLRPLSKHFSRQLVAEVLRRVEVTPERLRELIIDRAEGNPFFVEELIKMLVEDGVIVKEEPSWRVQENRLADVKVPETLTAVLQARLDRLSAGERAVMQRSSVIGRVFWDGVVARLAAAGEANAADPTTEAAQVLPEVRETLEALRGREMVFRREHSTFTGAQEYRFKHDLLQQVAYESVLKKLRRVYHALVAEWLTEKSSERSSELLGLIATHLQQAGDDERAVDYYYRAGAQALASFANQDAEKQFAAALYLVEDDRMRANILAGLGEAQETQSQFEEAIQTWKQAIGLFLEQGDKDRAAELVGLSGRAACDSGDVKRGLAICRQGLAGLKGAARGPGMASLLTDMARACYFNGAVDEIEQYAREALALAAQLELPAVQADALINMALVDFRSAASLQRLQEAIRIAEAGHHNRQVARAHNNLALVYLNLGEFEAAMEHYRRTLASYRQVGNTNGQLFTAGNMFMTLLILGRLDEVEAGLAEAEGLLEIVSGAASGVSRVRWAVAELHLRRGEFNDLESLIETIGSELRRNNDQHELFAVLRTQLTYLLLMDSGQEAEEVSQEFIKIAQSVNFVPDAHCCASILASKKGDPAQGRWHLQEARNSIESGEPSFLQRHLYFARADAHLLAGKQKWEPAWAKFGQNREALTANELRWDVAVCSMEWAEAHLLRGKAVDVARAKELFAEARAEFEAMGAPGWVQLIDEKMSALP